MTAPSTSTEQRGVQVAISVVQALVYLGMFLAVGLVVFRQLFLPLDPGTDLVRNRLLTLARRSADVGFVSALLMMPLTTINQRGDQLSDLLSARSWEVDLGNPEPTAAIMAVFGLALAVITSSRPRVQTVLPLVGGAMALGSLAVVGHSRSFGPEPLVVASDVAHVLAGSVWLGGLVGVAVTLRMLASAPELAARTVVRFSTVAAGLLATVGITGTVLSWRILGSFHGFVDSTFGRTLLIKLTLVAVVVLLAAVNRWRLLPAVTAAGSSTAAGARLRRAVRIEGLLLVAILAVTGVLVDRTPEPRGTTAASTVGSPHATAEAEGIRVTLDLAPASVGKNEVTVTLTDEKGAPLASYAEPVLTLNHGDLRLGDQVLTDHGAGTYHAEVLFPSAGRWTAEVTVRTSEFDARVIPVRLRIGR